MYTNDTPRIYVACLASYNAGVLHGEWIDVDDVETMEEAIAAMLRDSPHPNVRVECPECGAHYNPAAAFNARCATCNGAGSVPSAEEWAVHDYDGLPSTFGEYPALAELVTYAEAVEGLNSDEEREAFRAWLDNDSTNTPDADAFREAYAGTFDTLEAWAENFADETGLLQDVPDNIARYFDFESYGRDARLGGDVWTTHGDHGLHVFWNH